jgi:hypothetical protein
VAGVESWCPSVTPDAANLKPGTCTAWYLRPESRSFLRTNTHCGHLRHPHKCNLGYSAALACLSAAQHWLVHAVWLLCHGDLRPEVVFACSTPVLNARPRAAASGGQGATQQDMSASTLRVGVPEATKCVQRRARGAEEAGLDAMPQAHPSHHSPPTCNCVVM